MEASAKDYKPLYAISAAFFRYKGRQSLKTQLLLPPNPKSCLFVLDLNENAPGLQGRFY